MLLFTAAISQVFSSIFCLKIRGSSAPNATEGSICVHFVAMNSGAVNSNKEISFHAFFFDGND